MALTQTVRVWTRAKVGTDPMGEPDYAWSFVDVPGVLVRPGAAADVDDSGAVGGLRPDGVRVGFTLAFPKGYSGPALRHARVTLLHPAYGMDLSQSDGWRTALAVSGDPQPTIPCPTRWDTIAEVGRTDG